MARTRRCSKVLLLLVLSLGPAWLCAGCGPLALIGSLAGTLSSLVGLGTATAAATPGSTGRPAGAGAGVGADPQGLAPSFGQPLSEGDRERIRIANQDPLASALNARKDAFDRRIAAGASPEESLARSAEDPEVRQRLERLDPRSQDRADRLFRRSFDSGFSR